MENKEFDDMFRSLKDREITPSSNALKQLQDALNEADTKDKKKSPVLIWWVAAVAVILLSIGVAMYTSDKLEEAPSGIVLSETRPIEKSLPEKQFQNTQVAERKEEVQNVEIVEERINAIRQDKTIPKTSNRTQLASTKELKKVEKTKQDDEVIDKESVLPENTSNLDKRLAELLKTVEDGELNSLLLQEQVAIALEEIDDNTILQLLREAQMELQTQGDTRLASSQADRLLQQAEVELKANKSLRNIFNKAIETGVVQVEALFKRE